MAKDPAGRMEGAEAEARLAAEKAAASPAKRTAAASRRPQEAGQTGGTAAAEHDHKSR